MVGLAMAVAALIVERLVLRSVRKKGLRLPASEPTAFSSTGGDVDLDEDPPSAG